ncbi:MAG: mandelate racemase/muconate lactonizing enzyme family protein [Xanthobacteraceae bacterium]|uniref:mandelate racemase/muconate lactonizing enzyme family protein n=1 Tax=Pseudolabrys sp. TaxID=1960880 RepID=UPI003D1392C4
MARIVGVDIARVDYPFVGEFKFFRTPERPTILLRLTDDDGREGFGQSVPVESWTYETIESVETTLRGYLAPAVLGADPRDLDDIHARMERAIRPSFSVGQPIAKAAIDLACYDLWGKQVNKPVSKLLPGGSLTGENASEVRLSWTVQSPTIAGAEKALEQGRALGYSNFNIKVGTPQTPDYDLELVRTVMNFAPDGFHWCDANTSYSLGTAKRMAPKFADLGLKAIESPLPPNRFRDYQALKKMGALPVLMDEGIVSPVEVAEFIALDMFDGIAMKVARCGGLWNASRIATLLHDNGLLLYASGLTDPELSMAASAHFFGWAGLRLPAALNGPQYIADRGTTDAAFRARGDLLPVPGGAGLGVTPDSRALRALAPAARMRDVLPA